MGPDLGLYPSVNVYVAGFNENFCLGLVIFLLVQYCLGRWSPVGKVWSTSEPPLEQKAAYRRVFCRAHLVLLVAFVASIVPCVWLLRQLQNPVSHWLAGTPGAFVSLYGTFRDLGAIGIACVLACLVTCIWFQRAVPDKDREGWRQVVRARRFDHPWAPAAYLLFSLGLACWGTSAMTWGVTIRPDLLRVEELWVPVFFPQWRMEVPAADVAYAVRIEPGGALNRLRNDRPWPIWRLRTREDRGLAIDMSQARNPDVESLVEAFLGGDDTHRTLIRAGQVGSPPWKKAPAEGAP